LQKPAHQSRRDRILSRPEIQAIPDEKFERFLSDPVLIAWNTALKKNPTHETALLSEPEERLLALGSSALDGYARHVSQLTDWT